MLEPNALTPFLKEVAHVHVNYVEDIEMFEHVARNLRADVIPECGGAVPIDKLHEVRSSVVAVTLYFRAIEILKASDAFQGVRMRVLIS